MAAFRGLLHLLTDRNGQIVQVEIYIHSRTGKNTTSSEALGCVYQGLVRPSFQQKQTEYERDIPHQSTLASQPGFHRSLDQGLTTPRCMNIHIKPRQLFQNITGDVTDNAKENKGHVMTIFGHKIHLPAKLQDYISQ